MKERDDRALGGGDAGGHEKHNDPFPFIRCMPRAILSGCNEFEDRAGRLTAAGSQAGGALWSALLAPGGVCIRVTQ